MVARPWRIHVPTLAERSAGRWAVRSQGLAKALGSMYREILPVPVRRVMVGLTTRPSRAEPPPSCAGIARRSSGRPCAPVVDDDHAILDFVRSGLPTVAPHLIAAARQIGLPRLHHIDSLRGLRMVSL